MTDLDLIPEDTAAGSMQELSVPKDAPRMQDWDRMRTLDAFHKQARPLTANSYFTSAGSHGVPRFEVHKASKNPRNAQGGGGPGGGAAAQQPEPSLERPDTARPRLQTYYPRPQTHRSVTLASNDPTGSRRPSVFSATSGAVGYTPANSRPQSAAVPASSSGGPAPGVVNIAGAAFPGDTLGGNFPYQTGSLATNTVPFSAEAAFGLGGDLSPSSKIFGGNFAAGGAVAAEHAEQLADNKAWSAAIEINSRGIEKALREGAVLGDAVILPEGFENPFYELPPGYRKQDEEFERRLEQSEAGLSNVMNVTYDEPGKGTDSRFVRAPKPRSFRPPATGKAFDGQLRGPSSVIDSVPFGVDTRDPDGLLSPERATSPEPGSGQLRDHRPDNTTGLARKKRSTADESAVIKSGAFGYNGSPGKTRARPGSAFIMQQKPGSSAATGGRHSTRRPMSSMSAATTTSAERQPLPGGAKATDTGPRPDSYKFSKPRSARTVLRPPADVEAVDFYGMGVCDAFDDRNLKLDWNVDSVLYLQQLDELGKKDDAKKERQRLQREHTLQRMRAKLAVVGGGITSSYGRAMPELLEHQEEGVPVPGVGGGSSASTARPGTAGAARKGAAAGNEEIVLPPPAASSIIPGGTTTTSSSAKGKGKKGNEASEIQKMVQELKITPPVRKTALREAKSVKERRIRELKEQQMLLTKERPYRGARDFRVDMTMDAESSDDDVGGSTGFLLQQRKTAGKMTGLSSKKFGKTVVPGEPENEDDVWLRRMQKEHAEKGIGISGAEHAPLPSAANSRMQNKTKTKNEFFCQVPGSRGRNILRLYEEVEVGVETTETGEQNFQIYADQVPEDAHAAMEDLQRFDEKMDEDGGFSSVSPPPKPKAKARSKARAQLAQRTRGTFML
mmetsp:Transcript_5190/g.13103  ORF Transcript_5190/g.13103 Transcript_5190/m.13103 type:complete len:900 (-) Transcript_5190:528-3227(-)